MSDIVLYTSKQVAAMTGRADITIRKLAARKGIGTQVGQTWVFTDDDVERIRRIDPRGGTVGADGQIHYSDDLDAAALDRIKKRGPKRKTPDGASADADGSL